MIRRMWWAIVAAVFAATCLGGCDSPPAAAPQCVVGWGLEGETLYVTSGDYLP